MNNPALPLSSESIEIWQIRLDIAEDRLPGLSELLCEEERARVNRFTSERKAREFIITRASLRRILGDITGTDPQKLSFSYEAHGRPVLDGQDETGRICFNVTHSHLISLIAVTLDRQLGVDIEKIRDDVDHRNLARRYFSPAEYQALQRYQTELQLQAFFATWTRKEAIVKALGDGIAFGLKEFDVSVEPDHPPYLLATHWDPEEAPAWSLLNIDTDPGYVATLATRGSRPRIHYRHSSPINIEPVADRKTD